MSIRTASAAQLYYAVDLNRNSSGQRISAETSKRLSLLPRRNNSTLEIPESVTNAILEKQPQTQRLPCNPESGGPAEDLCRVLTSTKKGICALANIRKRANVSSLIVETAEFDLNDNKSRLEELLAKGSCNSRIKQIVDQALIALESAYALEDGNGIDRVETDPLRYSAQARSSAICAAERTFQVALDALKALPKQLLAKEVQALALGAFSPGKP